MGNERRDVDAIIFVVEESPEGGYSTRALRVPAFTGADGIRLLHTAPRDAVRCHWRPKPIVRE